MPPKRNTQSRSAGKQPAPQDQEQDDAAVAAATPSAPGLSSHGLSTSPHQPGTRFADALICSQDDALGSKQAGGAGVSVIRADLSATSVRASSSSTLPSGWGHAVRNHGDSFALATEYSASGSAADMSMTERLKSAEMRGYARPPWSMDKPLLR